MDKEKEYLYHLLSDALVDIRHTAHEGNDKKTFWISNFYHNLPAKLLNQNESYSEILEALRSHAKHDGMEDWFDSQLKQVEEKVELIRRMTANLPDIPPPEYDDSKLPGNDA